MNRNGSGANRKNNKSQDKRVREIEIQPEILEIDQPEWGTEPLKNRSLVSVRSVRYCSKRHFIFSINLIGQI